MINICAGEEFAFKFKFALRLKPHKLLARRQLIGRSFEIIGALTENALSAMTRDV